MFVDDLRKATKTARSERDAAAHKWATELSPEVKDAAMKAAREGRSSTTFEAGTPDGWTYEEFGLLKAAMKDLGKELGVDISLDSTKRMVDILQVVPLEMAALASLGNVRVIVNW